MGSENVGVGETVRRSQAVSGNGFAALAQSVFHDFIVAEDYAGA